MLHASSSILLLVRVRHGNVSSPPCLLDCLTACPACPPISRSLDRRFSSCNGCRPIDKDFIVSSSQMYLFGTSQSDVRLVRPPNQVHRPSTPRHTWILDDLKPCRADRLYETHTCSRASLTEQQLNNRKVDQSLELRVHMCGWIAPRSR